MENLSVPVLFLIFNRPETTRRVFDEIRKAKPRKLFVAADGPRKNRPDETWKCDEARSIIQSVDWDCEVKTLFRDENLGCGKAVSSAISWFFEQVEEGIILEDDCLPHPSFFTYCETMLERYRDNPAVWNIGGAQYSYGRSTSGASYHFSALPVIWGWATWSDRWKHYRFDVSDLPVRKLRRALKSYFRNGDMRRYWLWNLCLMKKHKVDTWDYQFTFSLWLNKGLALVADTNLISNIGFGNDATHTTQPGNKKANLPVSDIGQIIHPAEVKQDVAADELLHVKENRLLSRCTFICRRIYLQLQSIIHPD